jgi:hypothetical protein
MRHFVRLAICCTAALTLSDVPAVRAQTRAVVGEGAAVTATPEPLLTVDAAGSRPLTAAIAASTPMRDAIAGLARTHAGGLTQTRPANDPIPCPAKIATGSLAGAAAGFGSAFLLLASSGGSDSAREILQGFAITGAVLGAFAGTIWCF